MNDVVLIPAVDPIEPPEPVESPDDDSNGADEPTPEPSPEPIPEPEPEPKPDEPGEDSNQEEVSAAFERLAFKLENFEEMLAADTKADLKALEKLLHLA